MDISVANNLNNNIKLLFANTPLSGHISCNVQTLGRGLKMLIFMCNQYYYAVISISCHTILVISKLWRKIVLFSYFSIILFFMTNIWKLTHVFVLWAWTMHLSLYQQLPILLQSDSLNLCISCSHTDLRVIHVKNDSFSSMLFFIPQLLQVFQSTLLLHFSLTMAKEYNAITSNQ